MGTGKNTKWQELKKRGSNHYRKDPLKIEPIDLYKDGNMIRDFALCCIIKYAYRNRSEVGSPISKLDMEKIRHYADLLEAVEDRI